MIEILDDISVFFPIPIIENYLFFSTLFTQGRYYSPISGTAISVFREENKIEHKRNERTNRNMVSISKREMRFLLANGVKFGENGLKHTTARHRRNYFLCMTPENSKLHEKFNRMVIVSDTK